MSTPTTTRHRRTASPRRSVIGQLVTLHLTQVLRTRSTAVALGVGLALIALSTYGNASTLADGSGNLVGLAPEVQARQLVGAGFLIGLFAAAAAATDVVRDVRSGLYGALVLRVPGRSALLVARALSAALLGALFAVVATLVAAAVTAVTSASSGLGLPVLDVLGETYARVLLPVAAQAVLGSCVGWLLQRSGPSVMVLIAWIAIAEPALMAAWPDSTRGLLSGGAAGLMEDTSLPGRPGELGGLALEVAWVLGFLVVTWFVLRRRDVPSSTLEDAS